MFDYLPRWSRYGLFAACTLATAACNKPDLSSDLRPDGPPEVLTVSVNAPDNRDGFAGGGTSKEQVTFCKTQGPNDGAAGAGDPKRPDEVILSDESALELCPTDSTKPVDEITNALPQAWYARIQFDELLDPSIEDLVANVDAMGVPDGTYTGTLANTQPVTLKCDSATGSGKVDVPYDGYYSPSGSSLSYPLGPSLVIIPADPTVIATASECTITLKSNITDKDGIQVPPDQIGPYKFQVGGIEVLVIDPPDGGKQDPIAAGVDITFNTSVTAASINAVDMTTGDSTVWNFTPALLNEFASPEPVASAPSAAEYFFGGDFPVSGAYKFTFLQGAKLIDQCGKSQTLGAPSVAAQTQTSFTTNPLKLVGITGPTEPGAKILIAFNQYMDFSTLDPGPLFGGVTAEFTVEPAVTNVDVEPTFDLSKTMVYGDFKLGTMYTFTLKNGATIDDCPGGEFGACVKSTTYSSPMDQVVTFTTASAIVLKSATPADNSKASVTGTVGITLTFNQEIDPTTLVQDVDYTITPNVVMKPTTNRGVTKTGTYEQLRIAPVAPFPPGTYTFTLLKSGSVSDKIAPPDTFSPSADQVIHFTVTPNPTPTPPLVCL